MNSDQIAINDVIGALGAAQCITEKSDKTGAAFRVASEFLAKRDKALNNCTPDMTSEELDAVLDPIDAEFMATSILPQPTDTDFVSPDHVPGSQYATQYQEAESMELLGQNVRMEEVPAPEGWYFQKFVNGNPRGGYFGPYTNIADMPQYVQQNPLT